MNNQNVFFEEDNIRNILDTLDNENLATLEDYKQEEE